MAHEYIPVGESDIPIGESIIPRRSPIKLYGYLILLLILSLIFYIWFQIPFSIVVFMTAGKLCWFLIEYDSSIGIWSRFQGLLMRISVKSERFLGSRLSELLFGAKNEKEGRLKHLDAVRGIASLVIASHHLFSKEYIEENMFSAIQSDSARLSFLIKWYGYTMVEVFVVLSGFILAKVYWNAKRSNDLYKLTMNRLTRFFPLHVVTECAYVVISVYFTLHFKEEKKDELVVGDFVRCISLTHIWNFMPHPTGYISVCNGPAWSLSVELLMNLIMFVSIRFLPVYWSLFFFECLAFFGYFAVDNIFLGNSRSMAIFFSFFIGVFLFKLFAWVKIKSKVLQMFVDIFIVLMLLNGIQLMFVDKERQFESELYLTTRHMTYFATVLIFMLNNSFFFKKLLNLRFFTFLGEVSFALYLCHHSTLVTYDILIRNNFVPQVSNYFQVLLILAAQVGLASYVHFEYEVKAKIFFDKLWKGKGKINSK